MLTMIKRLRERMIGPIVHRIGELEANHTAYLSSHLDGIEANLIERLADSERKTQGLIERTREEMRDRTSLQLRSFVFERTCVKDLRVETSEGSFSFDVQDDMVGWSLAHEDWEPKETAWMKTVLRPGDFAIDIGANLGWFTVVMARQVANNGCVAAFEPEPRNFELLTRNVKENEIAGTCKLFQTALLDKSGRFALEKSHNNFGDHRIRLAAPSEFTENYYGELERKEITVITDTLDAILRREDLSDKPVRLLKIDAQGCEVLIMKGAQATLSNTEFLLIEYWPYGLRRLNATADDFYSCIKDNFSRFSRCLNGQWQFKPISEWRNDVLLPANTTCGANSYVFSK